MVKLKDEFTKEMYRKWFLSNFDLVEQLSKLYYKKPNKHKYLWEDNQWRKHFEYITEKWQKILKIQLPNWRIITKK